MAIQLSQDHLLKILCFALLNYLSILVKQLTTHFRALSSVLLIHTSVLVPMLHCLIAVVL